MAVGRRGTSARGTGLTAASTGRRRVTSHRREDGTRDVYQDMLVEATMAEDASRASERPLKRRRVARQTGDGADGTSTSKGHQVTTSEAPEPARKTSQEDIDADDSSASDNSLSFEDVDLEQTAELSSDASDIDDVSVSIHPGTAPKRTNRIKRKGVSASEKTFRLTVHKAHIVCLLGHCFFVNSWCNTSKAQQRLRKLLSAKILSYLNPKADLSQSQRNLSFVDGLTQASVMFRGSFRIIRSGIRRARWSTDDNESLVMAEDGVMDRADFIRAARNLSGSQDTGNQLFCALLRSAGVEARLVCSLQPLPFANPPSKSKTPQKEKATVFAMPPPSARLEDSPLEDPTMQGSATVGRVPSARQRIGRPSFAPEPPPLPSGPTKTKKPIRTLSYPIFWVEAFNKAQQKWIAVDPLVTQTVNRPSRIEPPSLYEPNHLLYAIAFESDGSARDVTKRYAKSFNAKTRRHRVESSDDGDAWLKRVLKIFRRPYSLDRDQVEDAEIVQREAREGLPLNILDFKDHPYYALERHLKRHEVIHPRREAGKVNAGTAAKPRMEPVFRREDVLACRSADKWFRLGRVIKEGEQPIKHVPATAFAARSARERSPDHDGVKDERDAGESASTALYSPQQTEVYIPAPVTSGRVPRNAYGNLDIYVPSMVPSGGTHIRSPLAQIAAKTLRVDYADAVTGFQFKARKGTAVIDGAIVALEYAAAVYAVIEGLQENREEEASMARSVVALALWKRFLTGLRITERVNSHVGDVGDGDDGTTAEDFEERDESPVTTMGIGEDEPMPTAGLYSLHELARLAKASKRQKRKKPRSESDNSDESEQDGQFENAEEAPERKSRGKRRIIVDDDTEDDQYTRSDHHGEELTGGFLPESDNEEHGGGFVLEDVAAEHGGGFIVEDHEAVEGGWFVEGDPNEEDSGFLPEREEDDQGGGFLSSNIEEAAGGASVDLGGGDEAATTSAVDVVSEWTSTWQSDSVDAMAQADGRNGEHQMRSKFKQGEHSEVMPSDNPLTKPVHGVVQPAEETKSAPTPESNNAHTDIPEHQLSLESKRNEKRSTSPRQVIEDAKVDDGNDQASVGSEADSMLSHDPEDEDAEPDWL